MHVDIDTVVDNNNNNRDEISHISSIVNNTDNIEDMKWFEICACYGIPLTGEDVTYLQLVYTYTRTHAYIYIYTTTITTTTMKYPILVLL